MVRNGQHWRIVVFSPATGRMRAWAWHGPQPQYLGWSGDDAIDFVASRLTGRPPLWGRWVSSLYRFSIPAPGSRVDPFRLLFDGKIRSGSLARPSRWFVSDLTITTNGRTAVAAITSSQDERQIVIQAVLRLSAVTGKPLAVLAKPETTPAPGNDGLPFCDLLWSDGSGTHLLVACGLTVGRVDGGRFTELPEAGGMVPQIYVNEPIVW